MWNGNNPPPQQMGMYTTTTSSDSAAIEMDAVSALLGVQAGGFAPQPANLTAQLVHSLSANNNNTTVPSYASATNLGSTSSAGVMGSSMLQRHYSEDYATQPPQSSYFGGKIDDRAGNGLFNHPYHPASIYGASLNGGGAGGGIPALPAVLPPQYAQVVPSINIPTGLPPSRQASSSSSSAPATATAAYHPLHPNDRPNVVMTNPGIVQSGTAPHRSGTVSNEMIKAPMEYNEVYHPPHPSERGRANLKVPIEDKDIDDDEMNNENLMATAEDEDEDQVTMEEENEGDDDDIEAIAEVIEKIEPKPRGKPEAAARALAAAKLEESRMQGTLENEDDDEDETKALAIDPPKMVAARSNPKKSSTKKASPTRKKSPVAANGSTPTASSAMISTAPLFSNPTGKREFLLGEEAPAITEAEYQNLQEMMIQFCRVPLLSEFSRPVAMLHPEVRSLNVNSRYVYTLFLTPSLLIWSVSILRSSLFTPKLSHILLI